MPIMCITYGLQYYDKVILGHAAVYGLIQDLGLDVEPSRYSNASMIFYCGYLLGAFPISYLSQMFPTGKVCAALVIVWSAIVLSTAGCTTYQGLLVNRFFLGMIESGVAPAFMLVVSMWYNKREQLLRAGLWYSFSGGSNLIVPVISFGIGHIQTETPSSWQWMFIIAGGITFLWSIVIFLFFPNSPLSAKGFTDDERALIQERMRADNAGALDRHFKLPHVLECLKSANFWTVNLMSMLTSVVSGPISSFGPLIFSDMGFTKEQSLLLNMPNGAMAFICILASATLGRRVPNIRLILIVCGCLLAVIGCCISWQLPSGTNAGRLSGFYMMNFFSSAYVQVIGLGTCNVGGYTKKATSSAGIFVFYCLGSIIGPQIFNRKDAPRYDPGFKGTMICLASCSVLAVLLRWHLARKNSGREMENGPAGTEHGLDDMTDKENRDFRYQL